MTFLLELQSLYKWKLWNVGKAPLTPKWNTWFSEAIVAHPTLREIELCKSVKEHLWPGWAERRSVKRSDTGDGSGPTIERFWECHWPQCCDEWKTWC